MIPRRARFEGLSPPHGIGGDGAAADRRGEQQGERADRMQDGKRTGQGGAADADHGGHMQALRRAGDAACGHPRGEGA